MFTNVPPPPFHANVVLIAEAGSVTVKSRFMRPETNPIVLKDVAVVLTVVPVDTDSSIRCEV
jgi:hypothetical protein